MIISFFEEFPTKEHLDKVNLIRWPTKIYLAAKSVKEFQKIKALVKNKYIKEWIYWPVLEKKEGYWISPFCNKNALKRMIDGIENHKRKNIPVMLDLELPTRHNPLLYLTQFFNFSRNKMMIRDFIEEYKGDVYLAEYYPEGKFQEKILKALGLHYSKAKVIKMVYHSLHHFNQQFITEELRQGERELGRNFLAAFGVIYPGIAGREPLLDVQQLGKDLQIAKQAGIREVVIYRLSGLNKEYAKILKKYATSR